MRDITLTALMAFLLPWALIEPHIGVYIWYWIGLMNPHRMVYGFAYNIPFALITAAVTIIGFFFTRNKKSIPWNYGLALMAVLLVLSILTNFTAWDPEASWEYWDRIIKIFASTFLMTMLIYGKKKITTLLLVAALSIGFYGIKGGLFSVFTGGQFRVLGPPGDTALSGNTFIGLALIMVIPLLYTLGRLQSLSKYKYALYASSLLCIVSVVFTYSRGALIGLAVMLGVSLLKSIKSISILLALIVLIPIGAAFVPQQLTDRASTITAYEEDSSAMQRVRSWHVNFLIALDHPYLGAGFNFEARNAEKWMSYMPKEYEKYGLTAHVAHSNYFQVLGTQGFIALAVYLLILISSIFSLFKLEVYTANSLELAWINSLSRALRLGIIGYATAGAFINTAFFDLFYLYVGITAVLWREAKMLNSSMVDVQYTPSKPYKRFN